MKVKLLIVSFIHICFLNAQESKKLGSLRYLEIHADFETDPVTTIDDAADDICVLENHQYPDQSLIISSDKNYGIIVYDLKGKKKQDYQLGRINNVDIIPSKANTNHFIVCGTNRTYNSIDLYLFDKQGNLKKQLLREKATSMIDVYGITFYNGQTNTYVFISDKKGRIQQWIYNNDESNPELKKIRTLKFSSIVEGLVVNNETHKLYISQERVGIWEVNANPSIDPDRRLIFKKSKHIKPDFEGLTIIYESNKNSQLIASVQGSNGYLVLDLKTQEPLLFFRIIDGEKIDGTSKTDGIDVSTISTTQFPKGFFIAQDDDNNGLNQNFKIVDLRNIIQ